MNNGLLILFLLIYMPLPTTAKAAALVSSEPATIYYTTNGAAPAMTAPVTASAPASKAISKIAVAAKSLYSAITDGIYTLASTAANWVGTDANRLTSDTMDYASAYGDESTVTYSLPWLFTFYGQQYSSITADTNGNIWFQNGNPANSFPLASTGMGPVIALWNSDLSSYFFGGVFIQKPSQDRIVIEWQSETFTDEGGYQPNNFEAVLFQNGNIRIDYKTFSAINSKDFGSGISKGNNTNFLSLTDNFGSVYNLAGNSYLFSSAAPPANATLNVQFSGSGSGFVTSSPSGIACNTNCSAEFPSGTLVTLHPAASQYSLFNGWSNGACSGSGGCILSLNSDSAVTAGFDYDSAHQVQISGGSTSYYPTIQDAYNSASDSSTIKLWATTYNESLICSRPLTVTLQGGYDRDYNLAAGESVLIGTLTFSGGSVIVDGLIIK
ncbi:MAG: hypothetical protein HXX17_16275 [Geobacteraceae bacterium]|nr:hypothetical protein [Geobacteraceae bacterium]